MKKKWTDEESAWPWRPRGLATYLLLMAFSGPLTGQEIEGLLEAVDYYHESATSDLTHVHEATRRFEAIAITLPADPEVARSWLPSYWTAFAYTQLALFSDDERAAPFVGLARLYFEKASSAHPDRDPATDADFHALRALILRFEAGNGGSDADRLRRESRAAWARARELDPNNPMMLMNGGLALIQNVETRDQAYELLDRAIELYEPRLGTVRPNWGREFIDVWTGSYPRGGPTEESPGQTVELSREEATTWAVRRDNGASGDDIRLAVTEAGLTARTGASSIIYRPDLVLSGWYRVEVAFTLFDPQRRNEGFGLVFGGTELSSEGRSYDYALLRQDGHTLLKRRRGDETKVLRDWALSPAMRTWASRVEGSEHVTNTLVLEVDQDRVRIEVNGATIYDLDGRELDTEGNIGVRVNHGVSLRVDRLTVTRS